jgi:hypothetical protein
LLFHRTLLPVLGCYVLISLLAARRVLASRVFLASFVVELLWMTKSGSNVNYLLGSIALFGLSLPYIARNAVEWYRSSSSSHQPIPGGGLLAGSALVLAAALAINARDALIPRNEIIPPTANEIAEVRNAIARYGASKVLCLDPFTAQRTGAFYPYAEPHHIAALTESGFISLSDVTERIQQGQFSLVVVNPYYINPPVYHDLTLFPTPIKQALSQHYTTAGSGRWLRFLQPK